MSKARQKNVNRKVDEHKKASATNDRWYSDLSLIKAQKDSGIKLLRPNWHLITDEYSGLKQSAFHKTKAYIVESTCKILSKARAQKLPVGALRQDNVDENKTIEDRCKELDRQLNVKFAYTARATPQQNLLLDTSFVVIAARAQTMMTGANLPTEHYFTILRGWQTGR